jgi:NAD(P)-dependent dehydrogenase (short-subunit alcohol dehydrogenase family)
MALITRRGKVAPRFRDKIALVTGGGSGIGKSSALLFAREGAKLAIGDLDPKGGMETVQDITRNGGQAIFVQTDVSKSREVEALVNKTVETFGKLDLALNNAGIGHEPSLTHEVTEETWERVISTNLKGVWLCLKYELPQMKKQGYGAIVNTSSIGGLIVGKGLAAYSAAKGGVNQLTKITALEYAEFGIRVNAVCPSVVLTPLTERTLRDSPQIVKDMIANQPMGRLAKAEEVASAIIWLCSNEASYVNGVCLPVDGGFTVA